MSELRATFTNPEGARHRVHFIEDEDGLFWRNLNTPGVMGSLRPIRVMNDPDMENARNLHEVHRVIESRDDWTVGWE